MPAMNNMISKWIPVSERSRALSLVYSGMYLGSVTGLGLSPALIHKFGWSSVFYSFGSLGSIWFAMWLAKVMHSSFTLIIYLLVHLRSFQLLLCKHKDRLLLSTVTVLC